MTDFEDFDDDDQTDEPTETAPPAEKPGWRKRLENERNTARTERDSLKRELAFIKAGVDPEADKRLAYFMDGYKGDLTAEAIKAEATAAGFLAAADTEADQIDPAERAAHERAAANATGESAGNYSYDAAIAEQKAAGNTLAVIALKQQQSAAARGE